MPMMQVRSLRDIAAEIRADWKPKVHGTAEEYVEAMSALNTLNDPYYADTAVSVVAYFLGSAGTWKGAVAKRVKAELAAMLTLHEK